MLLPLKLKELVLDMIDFLHCGQAPFINELVQLQDELLKHGHGAGKVSMNYILNEPLS